MKSRNKMKCYNYRPGDPKGSSSPWRPELFPGDLVMLERWCINKGRLAQVIDVCEFDKRDITIQYLDSQGLNESPSRAAFSNLKLIE